METIEKKTVLTVMELEHEAQVQPEHLESLITRTVADKTQSLVTKIASLQKQLNTEENSNNRLSKKQQTSQSKNNKRSQSTCGASTKKENMSTNHGKG